MKKFKIGAVALACLAAATDKVSAFVPLHQKKSLVRDTLKKTDLSLASTNIPDNMPSDSDLFSKLFMDTIDDNLKGQERISQEFTHRIRDKHIKALLSHIKNNIAPTDDEIFSDTFITKLSPYEAKHCEFNKIYIDKNNLKDNKDLEYFLDANQIHGKNTVSKIANFIKEVTFDTSFIRQKQFIQKIQGNLYPVVGFALKATDKNKKDVYFLMTATGDEHLRLVDIAREQYQLGDVF